MEMITENVSAQALASAPRTSFVSSEGRLCDPPSLVQKHLVEDAAQTPFWQDISPVSNPKHELETLRAAWQEMAQILANRPVTEIPEVFEMPPAPRVRVRGRVRRVYQAPFVFVDDLADQADE